MIIIGEKINATRKTVATAIEGRDADTIARLAKAQDEAGADVIDVNAGLGKNDVKDEIEDMKWLVGVVQKATDKPLAIDSENPEVLEAGLESVDGPTPWINSASAETERLDGVLPLIKKYNSPSVALCMDDSGLPHDADGRIKAAGIFFGAAEKIGIDPQLIHFDPLVMPIGTDQKTGNIILESIGEIKRLFPGTRTIVGLSNISFGLPRRDVLNSTFLAICMYAGLDAAIIDPTNENTMMALKAADALLGNDEFCMEYISQYRKRDNAQRDK